MTTRFRTSATPADRSINQLFASLTNEEAKHDVTKLYEGRLRSHARNFEVRNVLFVENIVEEFCCKNREGVDDEGDWRELDRPERTNRRRIQ